MIAFEERIYDAVVEDLQIREPTEDFKAIHVICLDTKVRNKFAINFICQKSETSRRRMIYLFIFYFLLAVCRDYLYRITPTRPNYKAW